MMRLRRKYTIIISTGVLLMLLWIYVLINQDRVVSVLFERVKITSK